MKAYRLIQNSVNGEDRISQDLAFFKEMHELVKDGDRTVNIMIGQVRVGTTEERQHMEWQGLEKTLEIILDKLPDPKWQNLETLASRVAMRKNNEVIAHASKYLGKSDHFLRRALGMKSPTD